MPTADFPPLGIIEGFYGRSWSWGEREAYATFLSQRGYHFYIYAPKSDPYLRKQWQADWHPEPFAALQRLVRTYHRAGLKVGLGLSPFELYRQFNAEARQVLKRKLQRVLQLQPDILCLLFDDMRGDIPELARLQIEICHFVADCLAQQARPLRLIMCPTYYSEDPVLEQVFGAQPAGYLSELGAGLDPAIDCFWTGPKVCSTAYPQAHLQRVAAQLQRKPFLWDNYPVNDGAKISRFLHLRSFEREGAVLREHVSGHAANPMNQPWLSRLPLWSLPLCYAQGAAYEPEAALQQALQELCSPALASALQADLPLLQDQGLDQMATTTKQQLITRYQGFADNPEQPADRLLAQEVADWLLERYAFDPACLTD